MEKNVFKFGESSVALILPKKWADKEGLAPKGRVSILEGRDGSLVLSARGVKERYGERVINRDLNPVFISRWIGLHYMYGTTKLKLWSKDGFSQAQLDAIEQKINNDCAGFEVTGQSDKELSIEDLTNIKEVDIDKIYSRLRFMIDQEFVEILDGNPSMVDKLERHVNRFYMLGIRYVNIIRPADYMGHIGVLNMLEQASDYLKEISPHVYARNRKLIGILHAQFKLCFDARTGIEPAIQEAGQMRIEIEKMISSSKIEKLYGRLLLNVADSFAGIAEYGFMAEKEEVQY